MLGSGRGFSGDLVKQGANRGLTHGLDALAHGGQRRVGEGDERESSYALNGEQCSLDRVLDIVTAEKLPHGVAEPDDFADGGDETAWTDRQTSLAQGDVAVGVGQRVGGQATDVDDAGENTHTKRPPWVDAFHAVTNIYYAIGSA